MKKRFLFLIGLSILSVSAVSGLWLMNKISAQSDEKTNEIPAFITFEQLFRIAEHHNRKASVHENQGETKKAELLRSYFQRKIQLDDQAKKTLEDVAVSFFREAKELKKLADNKRKAINSNLINKELGEDEIIKLRKERREIPVKYWNYLREKLKPEDFIKVQSLLTNHIIPRLLYKPNINDYAGVLIGYSEVDYDYGNDTVSGYTYTDGENYLIGCSEKYDCVIAGLDTQLTGSQQGYIDGNVDEDCFFVEYDYHISGIQPGEEFCVISQHGVSPNPSSYCTSQGYKHNEDTSDCVLTEARNVTGVDFQQIAPNTSNTLPIDTNPNAEGGLRTFPDDDVPMENQNRQTIRVRASISEQHAGVTVYFRNFDLDDPSTDMTIDPNGTGENDNNGNVGNSSAGQLSAVSATTNAQGFAIVNFTVTRQPGDNFAIAASTNQNQLNNVSVDGTALVLGNTSVETTCDGTDIVCRSEMLTVWRRLHIESDSMGNASQNFLSGTVPNDARIGRNQIGTIELNLLPNNPMEVTRFFGGRFVSAGSSLEVTQNTANTITVRNNNQPTIFIPAGSQFELYDDDDFNDTDGLNLIGDTGQDIPFPDRTRMTANSDDADANVFATAYVRPVYDVGDNNDIVPFSANVGEQEVAVLFNNYFTQQATHTGNTATEFWTVYSLGGYQFTEARDGDPRRADIISQILQTVYGFSDVPERARTGRGAVIFTEEGRNREYPPGWSDPPVSRAYTIAHEVGHLFGCIHADGGLMTETPSRTSGVFTGLCINQIRTATHP